jgi:predicted DNA-binding transcriptional regulator AlpA
MRRSEENRPDLVGDGYDLEPLYNAEEVSAILGVPVKSVYELPVPRVRIGKRRIRWRPADVREFIRRRVEEP